MLLNDIQDATIWSVFWDQGLGDIDLVIPKANRLDQSVPVAGDQWRERHQLCIVGLAYTVTTGVGPLGIRLTQTTPSGPTRTLWECASATAAVVTGGFKCCWPLSPAGADSASPGIEGGRVSIVRVGSVVSAQLTLTVAYRTATGRSALWATPPLQLD